MDGMGFVSPSFERGRDSATGRGQHRYTENGADFKHPVSGPDGQTLFRKEDDPGPGDFISEIAPGK